MIHLLGAAVARLRKPMAVVALASGLMGGALVVGSSSTAGAAVAFSGPVPPAQELQVILDAVLAVPAAVPSYLAIALDEATLVTNETQAQLQQALGAL